MMLHKKDASGGDFKEAVINAKRVASVVKGGKKFSFSVIVAVGDGNGSVGIGMAKHVGVAEAKLKAAHRARKSMIKVKLREGRTIHHNIEKKYRAVRIILRVAEPGTGINAGTSAMRQIFHVLGIKDITAKIVTPSSNDYAVAYATFAALQDLVHPRAVFAKRGKKSLRSSSPTNETVLSEN